MWCSRLDADTFSDAAVIDELSGMINVKINAASEKGRILAETYQIQGVPQLVFIDKKGQEIDRIVGYLPPEDYLIRVGEIQAGKNTLPDLKTRYAANTKNLDVSSMLAEKYEQMGAVEEATEVYGAILINHGDNPEERVNRARFFMTMQSFFVGDTKSLYSFIQDYPESRYVRSAYEELSRYHAAKGNIEEEIAALDALVEQDPEDPHLLNQYAWRMTELERNLESALDMARKSIQLLADDPSSQVNVLDTEAELLWKLDRPDEAIKVINKALTLDPENPYLEQQKDKFEGKNVAGAK